MKSAYRAIWHLRWLLLLLAGWPTWGTVRVQAAEAPPLTPRVLVTFGEAVTVLLPLERVGPVQRVEIFLRPEGEVQTFAADMTLEGAQARYVHPLAEKPLPLFAQVYYWFRIYPVGGEPYQSPAFVFVYEDNRFEWQMRTVAPVQVHWYAGDAALAETALNAALIALRNTYVQWQGHLPDETAVRVYVYANTQDLASALALAADHDVHEPHGRHIVLVAGGTSPAARAVLQREIAHQVAHIVLYDTVPEGYTNLPWWLREGLAALAEPQANPVAYQLLLDAAGAGQLFPMRDLCQPSLSADDGLSERAMAEDWALARAQAASFTAHLFGRYGPAGLQRLLEVYALGGLGCEDGFQAALGTDLLAAEQEWQAAQNLRPVEQISPAWVGLGLIAATLGPLLGLGFWYWRAHRSWFVPEGPTA